VKELDKAPSDLMVVEDDNSTDPYNSGVHRVLKKTDVVFIREDRVVVGDTDTIVEDFWK